MNLTPYHAKYFAHELTKRCSSDSAGKLTGAVASAQVDLKRMPASKRNRTNAAARRHWRTPPGCASCKLKAG